MLALVLLLTACKTPDDTDDTDAVDTDETDAPDTDVEPVALRVVPVDPAAFAGATLGLYPLGASFNPVTSEVPSATASLADDAYEVRFTPGEADLAVPAWAPDAEVALYTLVAGTDSTWVGAARMDALYVVGQLPQPYVDIGLHEGWNVLWVSGEEQPPEVGDPLALPIEANLVAREEVAVGGNWALDTAGDRVAAFSTEVATVQLGDVAAEGTWSVAVGGRPPEGTFRDLEGVKLAGFLVQAYADADTSGDWSDGDAITATATASTGQSVYVAYGDAPDTLDEVHRLVTLGGFRVGWSAVRADEGAWPLTDAEAAALEMR